MSKAKKNNPKTEKLKDDELEEAKGGLRFNTSLTSFAPLKPAEFDYKIEETELKDGLTKSDIRFSRFNKG